jgi:hypothetical protein
VYAPIIMEKRDSNPYGEMPEQSADKNMGPVGFSERELRSSDLNVEFTRTPIN